MSGDLTFGPVSQLREAKPLRLTRPLAGIVIIATLIAAFVPGDLLLEHLGLGLPLLRMAVIAAMTLVGAQCALACGLRLEPHGAPHPLLIGVLAAVGVAAMVFTLDAVLLRGQLEPGYAQYLASPLPTRLAGFMLRAFNENVIYRLFVFPALALAAHRALGRKAISPVILIGAMIAAQLINIAINVVGTSELPVTAARVAFDGIRYVAPGVLWALLFRRHGFAVAEVASVGCHVFLQPAFTLAF